MEERSLTTLFDCLASADRRRLLGTLHERAPHAVSRRDLATSAVQGRHSDAGDRGSDADTQRVRHQLHHLHLPKLESAGLIERDAAREAVTTTDHFAFENEGIYSVIDPDSTADSDSLDALFRALADARRRTVLDVLSHRGGAVQAGTLARELGARERGVPESEVPETTVDEVLVTLTHVHLPRLADADLIEYDTDRQTVEYDGHSLVHTQWMQSVL